MRPNAGSLAHNSHAAVLKRRQFLWSTAFATVAARLSVQQRPRRVVSTAPSITEALFALELAVCGAIGRGVMPVAKIPAGAVLALIGGPYRVWAIRKRKPVEEM